VLPETAIPAWAVVIFFILVVCIDGLLSTRVLQNIKIIVPDLVRISVERSGIIPVFIDHSSPRKMTLRAGLSFPPEIKADYEKSLLLNEQNVRTKFEWPITGTQRGEFAINFIGIESSSPLGFWRPRKSFEILLKVRVYPNLFKERRKMAAYFLNRGLFGMHARRQVGKGRDFEKLRNYVSGDSIDEIHWKSTAKRGHPVTKIFQIEKTQEIYVLIDRSRLSARSTDPSVKSGNRGHHSILEQYLTAALMLGMAAEKQGDLFGLVTFSDKVEILIRAKTGPHHFHVCRDAIYKLQSKPVTPDFEEIFSSLRIRLGKRALLVFLTSLDDPMAAESFEKNAKIISRKHLVMVTMINPLGSRPVFSGPEVESIDDMYKRLGGHISWQNLQETKRRLKHNGIQFNQADNEEFCLKLVSNYLNIKGRQVL